MILIRRENTDKDWYTDKSMERQIGADKHNSVYGLEDLSIFLTP